MKELPNVSMKSNNQGFILSLFSATLDILDLVIRPVHRLVILGIPEHRRRWEQTG